MIRLYFNIERNGYVDNDKYISVGQVNFMGESFRVDMNEDLESKVQDIVRKKFRKIKPKAYAVNNLGNFYSIDFFTYSENFVVVEKEEAAK